LTRRILAKVPGDSQAWARQAGAEIEVQDFAAFEAALAQWQQNVSPRPPEIDALRGDAEWMQSQREEAIKSWSAYLASAGRSLDERRATWRKLAGAHAELGQWKEARDRLTEWLSAEVTFEALIRRAAANRNLRDWDAARRDFEAAKNLNPSDPAVTNFGPLADAARLDELNARIEQAPRDPAAWLARATELARQRSFAAALEDIGHAQDLDPDALRLALERAHLLWQLGQPLPETPPLQPADDWTRDATKYAAAFSARQPLLEALSAADAHVKAAPATAAPYLERAAVLERLHQDAAAQADRQSASKF
jgi:tetratricopeptide (TPR) repeat protein